MKFYSSVITPALLLLSCTVLSGCMTANAYKDISKKQVFVDDYPKYVRGSYLGEVVYEEENYHHVFFNDFPWPSYSKTPKMHLYIPRETTKEVHIFNAERDLSKAPKRANSFYPNNSFIYLEPENIKPDNRYIAYLLIVMETSPDKAKELFRKRWGTAYYATIMMLNKQGPGTRMITGHSQNKLTTLDGRFVRRQTMVWEDTPFIVRYKPYRREWYSTADNLIYLITVPIDIVTSPFQAIYLGVGNWMMSGMGPK